MAATVSRDHRLNRASRAASEATGIETVTAAAREPTVCGGFWMTWETDWPHAFILAGNALDALSILSLHLGTAKRAECAVVSTGAISITIPKWIEAWSPRRTFCVYDATANGDQAARRLTRKDIRIVRLRPALDNQDRNHMLVRDRHGEPLQTDDQQINWTATAKNAIGRKVSAIDCALSPSQTPPRYHGTVDT